MVFPCGFNEHCPADEWCWASFHGLMCHQLCLLNSRSLPASPRGPSSCLHPGTSLKVVTSGHHRAHFICFPCLREYCLLFPVAHFRWLFYVFCLFCFGCFGWKVKSNPLLHLCCKRKLLKILFYVYLAMKISFSYPFFLISQKFCSGAHIDRDEIVVNILGQGALCFSLTHTRFIWITASIILPCIFIMWNVTWCAHFIFTYQACSWRRCQRFHFKNEERMSHTFLMNIFQAYWSLVNRGLEISFCLYPGYVETSEGCTTRFQDECGFSL